MEKSFKLLVNEQVHLKRIVQLADQNGRFSLILPSLDETPHGFNLKPLLKLSKVNPFLACTKKKKYDCTS